MISIRTRRQIKRAARHLFTGMGHGLAVLAFTVTVYMILAFPGMMVQKRGNDFRELARLPSYGEKR